MSGFVLIESDKKLVGNRGQIVIAKRITPLLKTTRDFDRHADLIIRGQLIKCLKQFDGRGGHTAPSVIFCHESFEAIVTDFAGRMQLLLVEIGKIAGSEKCGLRLSKGSDDGCRKS